MADVPRDEGRRGKDSQFYLNIKNTLGLEATKSRADLKNWALRDPAGYTAFRSEIYMGVVSTMVENNYQTIWELLSEGRYLDEGRTVQTMMVGERRDTPFNPKLPDPEISKLANGFAEAVMKAFDDVLSKVLPDNYKDLAEDKMKAVTGALGQGGLMR